MNIDLTELRRMATNLYDNDEAQMNRTIQAITALIAENHKLKAEIAKLKAEINEKPLD